MFDTNQKAAYAVYWEGVDCKQDNARNDAHIQFCIRFFFAPAPSTLSGPAASDWLTDWLTDGVCILYSSYAVLMMLRGALSASQSNSESNCS